ncbi:hypothetical protein [Cerasicoccus maritimus]|uniref:hypothetical protein n=1 Tax=Cerasicoccus maritimus TaxID=490089 RepID=UPI0028526DC5|nr:hypothetical protein [Cerasicoccus maritimus]
MKNKALYLSLSSLSLATICQAQWAPLVSDNFDEYTFGDQATTNTQGITWQNSNGATKITSNQLVTDETGGTNSSGAVLPANVAGTGNALYYFDNDGGVARNGINFSATDDTYDVARVDFDFSFVDVDAGNSAGFGNVSINNPNNTATGSSTNRAVTVNLHYNGRVSWAGGGIDLTNPNGSHSMSIVANGGDSSYSYSALDGSGTVTLASKSFDVYIDGDLLGTSVGFDTDLPLGRFGFTSFSTPTGAEFMIDNLETFAAVPEPAESAAYAAVVALIFCVFLRRRSS